MLHNTSSVLVTGGCGFIGANLVAMLVGAGARVRVLDNLSVCAPDALADVAGDVELIEGDVRDPGAMDEACRGVDVVFHLAARPGVIRSVMDPQTDLEVNATGTFSALLAAHRQGVSSFVYASSNAAVGEFAEGTEEATAPRPLSPYGASKLAGEAYCSSFAAAYGMHTVSLRFGNVYGPRSHHKQSVIARFIRAALGGEQLVIYGDGRQVRDFIHVEDVCWAMQLAAQRAVAGEILHVASGRERSVIELVGLLGIVLGRKLPVAREPKRDGEALRIAPSVEKARRLLGFEARISLPEGLASTCDWFQRSSPLRLAA